MRKYTQIQKKNSFIVFNTGSGYYSIKPIKSKINTTFILKTNITRDFLSKKDMRFFMKKPYVVCLQQTSLFNLKTSNNLLINI